MIMAIMAAIVDHVLGFVWQVFLGVWLGFVGGGERLERIQADIIWVLDDVEEGGEEWMVMRRE